MTSKIELLVLNEVSSEQLAVIGEVCSVTLALTPDVRAKVIQDEGSAFQAVLTIGLLGLTREEMVSMPGLKLICCFGVGYEGVDVEAAKELGISQRSWR